MEGGLAAGLLRGSVRGMITLTAVGATVCVYTSLNRLLAGDWPASTAPATAAMLLGLATLLLCRHREDLVYC